MIQSLKIIWLVFIFQQIYVFRKYFFDFANSKYLNNNQQFITFQERFSFSTWIRVLKYDQNIQNIIFFKVQGITENVSIQIEIQNQQIQIVYIDNLNIKNIQQTNWKIPLENGKQDIINQSVLYNNWIPLTILYDQAVKTIYLYSFCDLDQVSFNKILLHNDSDVLIHFSPNIYQIEVLYDKTFYIQGLIEQTENSIYQFQINGQLYGYFSYKFQDKSNQIIFNHVSQYNQKVIYRHGQNAINTQSYSSIGQTFYDQVIHLPNFQDSIAYFVQYIYLYNIIHISPFPVSKLNYGDTMNFYFLTKIFENDPQNVRFDLYTTITYKYTLSSKFFQCDYYYNINQNTSLINFEPGFVRTDQMDYIQDSILLFPYFILLKSVPKSDFQRDNFFRFNFEFQTTSYEVPTNFIHSKKDQYQVSFQPTYNFKYILILYNLKCMIFQNDDYVQVNNNNEYKMYINDILVANITLLSSTQANSILIQNHNQNDYYDLLKGGGNQKIRCVFIPNCRICFNSICQQCESNYYLLNNVCVYCKFPFIEYNGECQYPTQIIKLTEFFQQTINVDFLKIFKILSYGNSQVYQEKNIIVDNLAAIKDLYNFIADVSMGSIQISYVERQFSQNSYNLSQFTLCNPYDYILIDQQINIICLKVCPQNYFVDQQRICSYSQNDCIYQNQLNCGQNYTMIIENSLTLYYPSEIIIYRYSLPKTTPVSTTCSIECSLCDTQNLICYICNTDYQYSLDTFKCQSKSMEYLFQEQNVYCSLWQLDTTTNSSIKCIGGISFAYNLDTTTNTYQLKNKLHCTSYSNTTNLCYQCEQQYIMYNQVKLCMSCLNYDFSISQCLECQQNFVLINNDCQYQECLSIQQNCIQCDNNDLNKCVDCQTGFVIYQNTNANTCISEILGCDVYILNKSSYRCEQCQADYNNIDMYTKQKSLQGDICVLISNTIEGCDRYSYDSVQQTNICQNCQTKNYIINQEANICQTQETIKQYCISYDSFFNCIQCQTNYEIVFSCNMNQNTSCAFCIPSNQVVQYCQYYDETTSQCNQCYQDFLLIQLKCVQDIQNVLNCELYDQITCILCKQNFILAINLSNEQACLEGHQKIVFCIIYDNSWQSCNQCDKNYFLSFDQKRCINQEFFIEYCLSYSQIELICTNCQQGYTLVDQVEDKIICLDTKLIIENCLQYTLSKGCFHCDIGYFYDVNDKSCKFQQQIQEDCQQKVQNCRQCQEDQIDQCQTCYQGYILEDNQCIKNNCNEFCEICQKEGLMYLCSKCQDNAMLQYDLTCQQIPQDCYFFDKNCQLCQDLNQTLCKLCYKGFELNQFGVCQIKSTNQPPVTKIDCPQFCIQCNGNICLQCQIGFTLSQNNICQANDTLHNNNQLICESEILCYSQNIKVNQHCSQCKSDCKIQSVETSGLIQNIYFGKDIKLKNSKFKQQSEYEIKTYIAENYIEINHDIRIQNKVVNIKSLDFIQQAVNCTPQTSYIVNFQNSIYIKPQLKKQIQTTQQTIMVSSFSAVQAFVPNWLFQVAVLNFLNQEIFEFISFLQIKFGNWFYQIQNLESFKIDFLTIDYYFDKNFIYQFFIVNHTNDNVEILSINVIVIILTLLLRLLLCLYYKFKKQKHTKIDLQFEIIQKSIVNVLMLVQLQLLTKITFLFQLHRKTNLYFWVLLNILCFIFLHQSYKLMLFFSRTKPKRKRQIYDSFFIYSDIENALVNNQMGKFQRLRLLQLYLKLFILYTLQSQPIFALVCFLLLQATTIIYFFIIFSKQYYLKRIIYLYLANEIWILIFVICLTLKQFYTSNILQVDIIYAISLLSQFIVGFIESRRISQYGKEIQIKEIYLDHYKINQQNLLNKYNYLY